MTTKHHEKTKSSQSSDFLPVSDPLQILFQTARKQMQNLTVELFARDKNARRQLIDEALSVSSTIPVNDISPSKTPEQPAISPTPEPIQELVQVLLAPEPG